MLVAGFGIFPFHESHIGKRAHASVVDLQGNNVVATACHGQWSTVVFVVNKVREQENYALASHHAHEVFERPADVCPFAGGTDGEKLTDDAQDVSFTFGGWDELFDVIAEE